MPTAFTLSTLAHLWFTFCAIAVLEGIAIYTWQFRTEPGALWQALLQTDKGLWLAALSIARLTPGSSWNRTWQILCAMFATLSVYLWFRFITSLSGFERRAPRRLMQAILAIVAVSCLLYATNPWHHLMWGSGHVAGEVLRQRAHWPNKAVAVFAYALNLASAAINVHWALGCSGLRRRQAWMFLVPSLIAWTGQFLSYLPHTEERDPIAVSFMFAGMVAAWAFFRWRSYSVLPLAQETAVRTMIDGLMVIDDQGYLVRMNPIGREIFRGIDLKEGDRFARLAAAFPALAQLPGACDRREFEAEVEGRRRCFEVRGAPLHASFGAVLGQVIHFKEVTREKAQQARIVEQQRAISLLEERARLGRELHDGQGQLWSYVSMQLHAVRGRMEQGDPERALQLMEQLQAVVQDTHVGLRETITGLATGNTLKQGLLPALEEQLRWYREHCDWLTTLELHCAWEEKWLSPHTEAQLLRILQEALSNVRKSAQATRVRIAVGRAGDTLTFTVEDNGRGFDPEKVREQAGHHGLRMMQERADEIGAELRVESQPGTGTRVTVTVPAIPEGSSVESAPLSGVVR